MIFKLWQTFVNAVAVVMEPQRPGMGWGKGWIGYGHTGGSR
ncbi:MAG TPA: hypothetical protein VN039_08115 [Nitrospira sp.]|nr:hypothetical protein [Nitrospira sp.]